MEIYLSVVIPVADEQDNVVPLYDELRTTLPTIGRPFEVVFVDDGSRDHTALRLAEVAERSRTELEGCGVVRVVSLSRNFGQTAALQAGFDFARGEIIVTMDGDLQNDPRDIPRLLEALDSGLDVVSGWRRNRQDAVLSRKVPSRAANWLIARVAGVPIHDLGCALKAYRSPFVHSIHLYSDMHRFVPILASSVGARVGELAVHHRPRRFGRSKYNLTRVWKVSADLLTIKMLIHFRDRPLFWFASLGSLSVAGGLAFLAATVLQVVGGGAVLVFLTCSFLLLSLTVSQVSWGLLGEFFVRLERRGPPTVVGLPASED